MHGDISRYLFNAAAPYASVRLQQGRVVLDADFNEATDVLQHDQQVSRIDIIGPSGTNDDAPGFTVLTGPLRIGAGRYWVNGVRVDNPEEVNFSGQPWAPGLEVPSPDGAYAAWLEVWEQPATAIQDPNLRELALGGPDTTLRHVAAWAVRLKRVGSTATVAQAQSVVDAVDAHRTGGLMVREQPAGVTSDPCVVAPSTGYRGLENRLYRVQIVRGDVNLLGVVGGAPVQYAWSRDNASIIGAISSPIDRGLTADGQPRVELRVDRLGPGGAAGLEPGDVLELADDARQLNGTTATLVTVESVDVGVVVVIGQPFSNVQAVCSGVHPMFRRWESGALEIHTEFAALEDGIEVAFKTAGYRTGDFWLIGARTAALPSGGHLIWPASSATAVAPFGYARHRALLGVLTRSGGTWTVTADARRRFTSLTELTLLTTFAATSGDGQHGRGGVWLPAPASVLVFRGDHAEAGVQIRFSVESGGGTLAAVAPDTSPSTGSSITVTTGINGVARVWWQLGTGDASALAASTWPSDTSQTITAQRLGPDGTPIGPIQRFHATRHDGLMVSIVAGDGQVARPGATLDLALRVRATWLGRPVSGTGITFELDRSYNGAVMTEERAGGLNPSAGPPVSGDLWPASSRYWRVTVNTDADGVALVQLTLGSLRELPTRYVRAWLTNVTPSSRTEVRLSAHLLMASEIDYPAAVAPLSAILLNADEKNVQRALDELSRIVNTLQQQHGAAYQPFTNLRANLSDTLVAVESHQILSLTRFRSFVFDEGALLRPGVGGFDADTMDGVRVELDVPIFLNSLSIVERVRTTMVLKGSWKLSRGNITWTMNSYTRAWLNETVYTSVRLAAASPAQLQGRLVVVARHLPRAQANDSTIAHEWPFKFSE